MTDFSNPFQDRSEIMRHADIEAKDAEIARLRAAINNALLEPWLDGQLNGTWQQEPIGPNETPEEAIKRLVSVRAEWAVYKNNCENPVIAELRAALANARREGVEEVLRIIADFSAAFSRPECCANGLGGYTSSPECCGNPLYLVDVVELQKAIRAAAKEGETHITKDQQAVFEDALTKSGKFIAAAKEGK